ncbi:MAG: hypothetical protein NT031_11190 [Planctomycetota bacterium]|nr:hypothetical protein [Planctomycetota bacterium]
MSNPTESPLSGAAADALSGTVDPSTGAIYNTIGASTYYTAAYQKEAIWNRILALPNQLRVVKDGALTFGVMGGMFRIGIATYSYPGSAANALTDNATNYIYLLGSGTLTCNTTGFPVGEDHVPLAVISCASGAYAASDIQDCRGRAVLSAFGAAGAVEASTAASGSPNVLTVRETGKTLTNEGATARNYHTLPSAAAGMSFEFVVQDSDGMRIVAAAGDTIRVAGNVSAAAGYIQNATVGSAIRLLAVNATEWIAVSYVGTWTVDS